MIDQYKRILVAVDGSENSEFAFKHAVEIAKRNDASLYVLQVINDQKNSYNPYSYGAVIEQEQIAVEAEMARLVVYARQKDILSVHPLVRIGNPKLSIAKTVPEKFNIDLIVVGATGKGVINRLVLGSTTNYVVQNAECNVLVVKHLE